MFRHKLSNSSSHLLTGSFQASQRELLTTVLTHASRTSSQQKSASKLAPDGHTVSVSDAELIESLMGQHTTMSTIMQSRLTNLAVVRTFWARNDLTGAIEAMEKMGDHALLVDVLGTMAHRTDVFTLELAAQALPLLHDLLTSQHDRCLFDLLLFSMFRAPV